MRRLLLVVVLLAAALTQAMADDDQDAARHAREAGAVPFEQILERVRREHPGRLLGVELEHHGERLVYELRILAPGGHIEEWRYDAQDATPVPQGHDQDHEERH